MKAWQIGVVAALLIGIAAVLAVMVIQVMDDGTEVAVQATATPSTTPTATTTPSLTVTPTATLTATFTTTATATSTVTATLTATVPPFPTATPTPTAFPSSTPTPANRVMIASAVGAFIRSGPGEAYDVVREVPNGNILILLGYQVTDTVWYLVETSDGLQAWVSDVVAVPLASNVGVVEPVSTIPNTPIPTDTLPPTLTFTPTWTRLPPVGIDAFVDYGSGGLRLRDGPGQHYDFSTTLVELAPLSLLGRSQDGLWFRVQVEDGRTGWVMGQFVALNREAASLPVVDVPTSVPTTMPTVLASPQPIAANHCISLVGDSVAFGDVVYQIPGYGYSVVQTAPVAEVLRNELAAQGYSIPVFDRSLPAATLSTQGAYPYMQSDPYRALLGDGCRVTVMLPWLNDLSIDRPSNAQAHINELTTLLASIRQANPATQLVLLGFYYGEPANFVWSYTGQHTPENVAAFNRLFFAACAPDGPMGRMGNVICLSTEEVLGGRGGMFAGPIGEADFRNVMVHPPLPHEMEYFNNFWTNHPNDPVIGDGIHLTNAGKAILSQAVIGRITPFE